MTIRDNEKLNVRLTSVPQSPIVSDVGTLLDDVLNVVSPSCKGKAFVPQTFSSKQSVFSLIGLERENFYGHLYDQLHFFTPNQGIDCLSNWFDNAGKSAVHTRVLGIGNGELDQTTKKYKDAGFELADKDFYFVYTKTSDSEFVSELGLDSNEENYFLTHAIVTPQETEVVFNNEDNSISNEVPSNINIKYTKDNITKYSYEFSKSLLNKKPINLSTLKKDNIFSTEILNENHYVYTRFFLNTRNERISCKIKKTDTTTSIKYNSFNDHYKTAKTPWVTSQPYDRTFLLDNRENIHEYVHNLFRFWALDDGEVGNRYKIKINPKSLGDNNSSQIDYSKFDVYFFEYDARVNQFMLLESYEDLTLNCDDNNYIGRRIGTKNKYFDLSNKKVVIEGEYDNVSSILRVEINKDVEHKVIQKLQSQVPSGFRAYPHIDCSNIQSDEGYRLHANPVKFYRQYNNVNEIDGLNNTWGAQMYQIDDHGQAFPLIKRTNNIVYQDDNHDFISPHYSYTKFFSSDNIDFANSVWKQEDSYLNNFFHIEKISLKDKISSGFYLDSGRNSSLQQDYDYLNIDEINFNKIKNKVSFDLFTYGGFDGTDIFDFDKKYLTNKGMLIEEYDDLKSSISAAYKTSINQITKYENCNGTILAVPDISSTIIHKHCLEIVDSLSRYVYIGDIKDFKSDISLMSNSETLSNYYLIEKKLSNYSKNEIKSIPYDMSITDLKIVDLVNNKEFQMYDSKNFFTIIGDTTASITNDENTISKYISPVTFVTNLMSNKETLKQNITSLSPLYVSSLGNVSNIIVNDSLQLRLNSDFENIESEIIKNALFNLNVNTFTMSAGINRTLPGLLTAHGYSGNDFTINRKINITRAVQHVKNSIMIDLYTNTEIISDTVLFNTTSRNNNIYQRIKIQLTLLMESLVSEGIISGYIVNIDPNYINNNFNDIVNHKLKGNIIIQFGQSNIIELDLDNVLNELNDALLTEELTLPRVI